MKDQRIPWDQYFMMQAVLLSTRSTCERLSVGATIVRDKRIIAGGITVPCPGTCTALMRAVTWLMGTVFERFTRK